MDKSDPCFPNDTIHAAHHSGKRDMRAVNLIVLHDTEGGPNAKGSALWFADKRSAGSTHLVAGEDGCFRCLPDDVTPWGAPGANSNGLHIEIAGFAAWPKEKWLGQSKTMHCAAKLCAEWCFLYDIPVIFMDAEMLQDSEGYAPDRKLKGITTHAEVSRAFKHSNHFDPGPNFPVAELLAMIQGHLDELRYPPQAP